MVHKKRVQICYILGTLLLPACFVGIPHPRVGNEYRIMDTSFAQARCKARPRASEEDGSDHRDGTALQRVALRGAMKDQTCPFWDRLA